jgi:hypothetical protein
MGASVSATSASLPSRPPEHAAIASGANTTKTEFLKLHS